MPPKDKKAYKGELSTVSKEVSDHRLKDLDELYGVASRLSRINQTKHRRILLSLAITGTLLTLFFLIYDGAGIHSMIIVCIIALLILYLILRYSNRLQCHKKYLEYRILAETCRVQFFLSIAAVDKPVTELIPWFVKKDVEWIEEVIGKQPVLPKEEKKPIVDFWIRNQIDYHTNAIKKEKKQQKRDSTISKAALGITIAAFIILLLFEWWVFFKNGTVNNDLLGILLNWLQSHNILLECTQTEFLRTILKTLIGTMSAATLFIGSYYGKMFLANSIKDHERMIELYQFIEKKMKEPAGETEELIIGLAREFLIENGIWYAYQNQNEASFVF